MWGTCNQAKTTEQSCRMDGEKRLRLNMLCNAVQKRTKMKPSRNSKPYGDNEGEVVEMQRAECEGESKASQMCIVCEMHFAYNSDYLRHMRIHTGEKPYTCNACRRQFSRQSNLNVHMLTHSCSNFHTCSTCDAKFRHMSSWKRHMRLHIGTKPYMCEHCSKQFYSKYKLTCHLMAHKGRRKNGKCKVPWTSGLKLEGRTGTENSCLTGSTEAAEMELGDVWRLLVKHGVRRYPDIKSPVRLEKSNGKRDVSIQGGMLIQCEELSSTDQAASKIPPKDQTSSLAAGVSITKNLRLQCASSDQKEAVSASQSQGNVFPGHTDIRTHQNQMLNNGLQVDNEAESTIEISLVKPRHVLPEVTEVEVPSSDETISSPSSSKETCKRTGSRAALFCHECKKYFLRKNDLDRHRWTHTGEKPYMCEQCSRTFARQSNLKVHMLTHNPEKRFSCDLCELKFVHGNSYRRHMRIHRGEKLYMCERCSQQFYTHDKLKCHTCYF